MGAHGRWRGSADRDATPTKLQCLYVQRGLQVLYNSKGREEEAYVNPIDIPHHACDIKV